MPLIRKFGAYAQFWGVVLDLILTRHHDRGAATPGTLAVAGREFCTLECPWRDNQPFISCIPVGSYRLLAHDSAAHPGCFALVNPALHVVHEPGDIPPGAGDWRYACLIHPANWVFELAGCVALGRARANSWRGPMVTESRAAMRAFRACLKGQTELHLEIKNGV